MDLTALNIWLAKQTFNKHRHEFYIDLAEALSEDDTPLMFLTAREERARLRKDPLADLYALWIARLPTGNLAAALEGTVPDTDVLAIASALKSDRLVEGLRFLAATIVSVKKMKDAVLGAMVMPCFVIAMLIAMLVGFSKFMVPLITKLIKPEAWHPIGKALYAVSSFVTNYGPWVLALIVVALVAYFHTLPRWNNKVRTWLDNHLVFYTIYRDYTGSLFLVMLAGLLKAGVAINEALDTLRERSNGWVQYHIDEIKAGVINNSQNVGRAFSTGIFNERLSDRIIDFGARERFELALEKVGLDSIEKTTVVVQRSAKIINYTLLFVCGGMMIFMISGTMLTLQEVNKELRKSTMSLHR